MTPARRALLRFEIPAAVGAVLVIGLAAVLRSTGLPEWIPQAPLVHLGVASPLSGMTRSFITLLRGDVAASFGWHPLGPLVFAVCVFAPIVALTSWTRGRPFASIHRLAASGRVWLGAAVVFGGVWIRQIATFG